MIHTLFYENRTEQCFNLFLAHECYFMKLEPNQVSSFNSSPPGQNGRHFTDDISRCIFVNEMFCFLMKISLKFVPKGPVDNKPALV